MQRIHFIGIGGVGMNGLAQLAALSGYSVSGSDRAYDPSAAIFQALAELGISLFPQDASGITPATRQVVFSTAIESDNPDLERAKQLEIPCLHRAMFLKQLIGTDRFIAVAGTAGKTTTTGLLGWIFECLGEDPSVYNGAAVLNWKTSSTLGNIRKGKSKLWIIEADESDKSFLNFNPTHSIITNISKDHYELNELNRMFDQFETQTTGITIRGQSYKLMKSLIYRTDPYSGPLLGRHNAENMHCAAQLCEKLGMDMDQVWGAMARFKGIERRLEVAGRMDGMTVLDDYAHNPVKIAAVLEAVSEQYTAVHAFWRPHGFTPLAQGMDEFVEVFSRHWKKNGGSIFILPVYYAGGTVDRVTSSAVLVEQLNSAGVPAQLVADYAALKVNLEHCARPGDALLGMGARDPELPQFARQLVTQWKSN